jgi:soluble lytic murein transglycosylase-like protein
VFRCPIPERFRPAFVRAARDTDLPLALLAAVAQVESRFQPRALSHAGAQGLLQVMPETADALKLDASDPGTNVLAGARFLRRMLDRFNSTDLALAAYNAGPTAVANAGGAPGGETITYVANVTDRWRTLVGCS